MITTLKQFEVRRKDNDELISSYSLKLNGYRYELHSTRDVFMNGLEAERHYNECLEVNKLIVEFNEDLKLVEVNRRY